MTVRFFVGLVFFCTAMAGILLNHDANTQMAEELDRDSPNGDRYLDKVWSRTRSLEISAEYRRRFPQGTLDRRWKLGAALAVIGWVGTVACMFLRFK